MSHYKQIIINMSVEDDTDSEVMEDLAAQIQAYLKNVSIGSSRRQA